MPPWLTLLACVQTGTWAPPTVWAANLAAPPRIPAVGDLNLDGYADLIAVYPEGEGIVDVSISVQGLKPGRPFQGLKNWGKGCTGAIVGDFDSAPGNELIALVGQNLEMAGGYPSGSLKPMGRLGRLPKAIPNPGLWNDGSNLYVVDRKSGKGFRLTVGKWEVAPVSGKRLERPPVSIPSSSVWLTADADKDGDLDGFEFRYGTEPHTAYEIHLYRKVGEGESDSDGDGLPNGKEVELKTDPLDSDSDNDGLLDGWEVSGFRGLDLPAMGCSPLRKDVVCLISRFEDVPEAKVKTELDRVVATYKTLPAQNPDGTKGWGLHLLYRDPIKGDDMKRPWWENRDRNLPGAWRGLVHWMQITQGGGGQADQMGDGGTCGLNALWAVFQHEFGHQLGMDHNGFWGPAFCPIYRSLMSYAYSYSLEDDGNRIAYSQGEFNGYTLDERKLDEVLPLPYEKVKFLEKGPYRFRLKKNGGHTLIDWNWNGVFGEKGIRADINYAYATSAGIREEVDRSMTAPWLFSHRESPYALFGQRKDKLVAGKDPNVSSANPGKLILRRLIGPKNWDKPRVIDDQLIGDPVAISAGSRIHFVYQRPEGVVLRRDPIDGSGTIIIGENKRLGGGNPSARPSFDVIDKDSTKVPTVGQAGNRTFIFLWDPATGEVTYRSFIDAGKLGPERRLFVRSTVPIGMAVDTVRNEVILGMAQDQNAQKTSRWQVRRFREHEGLLEETGVDWVDGESGNSRVTGRVRVLFRQDRDTGPTGRIYMYAKGLHGATNPWACVYVAESVADKTVRGGWLVKRFYDEWTQTRSAPGVTWYRDDILYAYRWVDGGNPDRDNLLHVGYRGLGIDSSPMGDHDDLKFLGEFGIRTSITWLNP